VAAALHRINNNAFYGFNTDQDDIKATLYPNIAWICKEILQRFSGENTLRTYQGWARGVAHSVVVERIFTAYQNHQAVQFDDGPDNVALQNARDMIDLVARNNNLTR
jgi:hypothetical protein